MINITILLFAHFADIAGSNRLELQLNTPATIQTCAEVLINQHPSLTDLLKIGRAAVNGEFASAERILEDGDEVAFLPPVSGG